MKFVDEAKIFVKAGNGGSGCISFRREANVPFGGPDGGNGGKGGDVTFVATTSFNTLIDYRYKKHFKAQNGESGKGASRFGKKGDDIILRVPVGTQILSESGKVIADLDKDGETAVLLEGGKGGAGNEAFKSSKNRAPRMKGDAGIGEELNIDLQLKVISDLGIIGFPNAGKSTLLSVISRARPKIADYPFTTLAPSLGVVYAGEKEFVMADIPGLIEGASEGIGLGHKFLKHVERCKALVHLIDINNDDLLDSYRVIRKELEEYSEILADKEEIIILNKTDLLDEEEIIEKKKNLEKALKKDILTISTITQVNLEKAKYKMLNLVYGDEENW